MTCSGCFLRLKPDSWCAECVEVARENQLRAMRLIEVVEADPSIFSAETRASAEMMRWIVRYYQAREQQDERANRLLAEIYDPLNGVEKTMRDIEEVLDQCRCPDAYPGKTGIPCHVEALIDALGDVLTALDDLLKKIQYPRGQRTGKRGAGSRRGCSAGGGPVGSGGQRRLPTEAHMTFGHEGWDPPPELCMPQRKDLEYGNRCPECRAWMVLRKNHRTQTSFWGCTAYPGCTHTEPCDAGDYDEDDDEDDIDAWHPGNPQNYGCK